MFAYRTIVHVIPRESIPRLIVLFDRRAITFHITQLGTSLHFVRNDDL